MKAIAISPAKVILFGEHFVVGGNSAISMAIDLPTLVTVEPVKDTEIQIRSEDLGLEATFSSSGERQQRSQNEAEKTLRPIFQAANFTLSKINRLNQGLKIHVKSKVPIGMGLGSSAATAVATVSAISKLFSHTFTDEDIFESAYSLERMVHGHPSGIDQATVTYGGLISYRKGKVEAKLPVREAPSIIIGNTGRRRSTGEFVGKVTRLRETEPTQYAPIASAAQRIAEDAIDALKDGRTADLGSLMNENQRFLKSVGVSSPELERLISAARSAGALGAKLTGGGGGGCMIALAEERNVPKVSQYIEEAGGKIVPSEFHPQGVKARLQET